MRPTKSVHIKFCKNILNVKSSAKTELVYFESGRFPLDITFKCRLLKYWCKLLNLENTHPCKCAYIELISTCDLYRNWATDVKDLLFSLGLGYVWINQEVCDVNSFVSTVKQRLQDICVQTLRSTINTSSKARFYKCLNVNFKLQDYLTLLPEKKYAVTLTKLRISCHKLFCETGSWNRGGRSSVLFNQRICKHCKLNEVEDEFHFLCKCTKYSLLRKQYLPFLIERPSMFKVINLMCSDNRYLLLTLAKFVYHAMKQRDG
jgi:hypothetical protein